MLAGWSGTVFYDRRQKKIIQQKWCNAVSHLSEEPLATNALPRKVTVYLAAPPGDSLRPMREHFQEYVKPILVAAGVDWETFEGRKEGDIRAALAEHIRKKRRKEMHEQVEGDEDVVENLRASMGVHAADARRDELIIGRHTWKEYIRGLHEGWLGPIHEPQIVKEADVPTTMDNIPSAEPLQAELLSIKDSPQANTPSDTETLSQTEEASQTENQSIGSDKQQETKAEEAAPTKPSPTPPYILPKEYPFCIANHLPSEFPVSAVIGNPHLLGFLKTPTRVMRFLNRRRLAEDQGREVVNLLLTKEPRSYSRDDRWQQIDLLESEERDWHKSARAPNPPEEESKERPRIEEMVIDDRVGSRMRKADYVAVGDEPQGHLVAWKGGADPMHQMGWWKWLKWAFDVDYPEPKCKGWEDGLKVEGD